MKIPWWLPAAAIVAGLIAFGVIRGCDTEPTKVEERADSVLATVPDWQDSARIKDSLLQVSEKARARERLARISEGKRADSAEAKAISLQAMADTLALIPVGTASDSVGHLTLALAAQKKAAAQFALTVDTLKAHRARDSVRLATADATIIQLQEWREQDRVRKDLVTKALGDLREEAKRRASAKFLGIFPRWTDEALLAAGAAYAGYQIGRAAS